MKAIEHTTLSIDDITDHHKLLEQQHCIDLFLPANRRQEVADEMLERFCETFLERPITDSAESHGWPAIIT